MRTQKIPIPQSLLNVLDRDEYMSLQQIARKLNERGCTAHTEQSLALLLTEMRASGITVACTADDRLSTDAIYLRTWMPQHLLYALTEKGDIERGILRRLDAEHNSKPKQY